MRYLLHLKRDYYAGALMILIGLIAAHDGTNYQIGSLQHMGPGYFPIALGAILVFLGFLIAVTAGTSDTSEARSLPHAEWRGWLCIIAGPAAFILLGRYGGMLPATFACVFIASLGDRQTTFKGALILSTSVTVFGVILFHYLLKIAMPVLTWGGV